MRRALRFMLGMIPALLSVVYAADSNWLHCSDGAMLPDGLGVAGAFVGTSGETVIVAGGSNFPVSGGPKAYTDTIYAMTRTRKGGQWIEAGRLPEPVAYGAAVSISDGLLCLGGENENGLQNDVFLLTWDEQEKRVIHRRLPLVLPEPCSYLSATLQGNTVFLAGGKDASGELQTFWALDLPNGDAKAEGLVWRQLASWPGPARFGAGLISQHDGDGAHVYLFSGKGAGQYLTDAFRYNVLTGSWSSVASLPRAALLAPAIASGQSHILVFSGSDGHDVDHWRELGENYRFPDDVLAYHTITDTWTVAGCVSRGVAGTQPVHWQGRILIPGGEVRPTVRTAEVQMVDIHGASRSFTPLDYIALIAYLAALVLVGCWFSGREKTTSDFFLGGHRIPWWAAGLSLLATQVSSIGFMAIPAKSFTTNWVYFTGVITWFAVVPVVTRVFIPLLRRFNVTTAYEYLETRFDVSVRCFAALIFSLMQLGRMAVVLYLPAAALSAVTGLSTSHSILIMGVLATAYTVAGGMEAVVWTDVVQAFVLLGGALLCIGAVIFGIDGGVGRFLEIAAADGKLRLADPGWSMTAPVLWVVLVGNVFSRLAGLTSDQAVVQRYLTTKDEKASARALWLDVAVSIPWAVIVFGLGTALYVFYKTHPQLLTPAAKAIDTVPFFIAQQLPTGVSGIVIAAIFAAAMSSLDSSMHSVATTWTNDFYARFKATSSDLQRLRFARVLTLLLGLFGTGTALAIASSDIKSLWDFFIRIMGLFSGGICGVFLLGLFVPRASAKATLLGALVSVLWMVVVWQCALVHPLLYTAVGVIIGCFVGIAASVVFPRTSPVTRELFHVRKENLEP